MKIIRPLRSKKAAKRLDLSDLRHVMRDERMWCSIGVVIKPTDGSPHWRIETDETGAQVDIMVEVVLQPSQIPVTARLAAGMWTVPALDEEVAIIIPDGRVDFMPICVAVLSSNVVPGGGQGPSPTQIVIARGKVLIHDGNGGAQALALKSDVDAVKSTYDSHTHILTLSSGTGTAAVPATPIPSPTGTTVLEAK